jgi:hypothetical protein
MTANSKLHRPGEFNRCAGKLNMSASIGGNLQRDLIAAPIAR